MSAKDRASKTASSLFTSTKKGFFRAKQQAMVKMGKAEQTVDITYNQEKERFLEHYKAIKKLNKDMSKLMEILRDFHVAHSNVSDQMYNMFDTGADMYNTALKNQDTAKILDGSRVQFDEEVREQIFGPLQMYQGQFSEVKDRIEMRHTRRVDMDRYSSDVKRFKEKYNTAKLQVAEVKYEAAQQNYNKLNEELLTDLPALWEDRLEFFKPVMATYLSGLAEYYRQCAKSSADAYSMCAHIDKRAALSHPRITTDTEESAAHPANKIQPDMSGSTRSNLTKSDMDSYDREEGGPTSHTPPSPRKSVPTPTPTPTPSAPPASNVVQAKALYDFAPQESGELGFSFGDILIIHAQDGEWWEGELNGERGVLPANYVELL